jgi:DNA uptake protein ComE-like DNA-binding protein
MGNILKDYFEFNKTEKKGIIGLLILIIFVLFAPVLYSAFFPKKEVIDYSAFKKEMEALEITVANYNSQKNKQYYQKSFDYYDVDKSFAKRQLQPFPFNPNTASAEDYKKMGLSDKQIQTILNYRSKGGKYYKKEDFAKMYCISEEEYEVLEDYITIDKKDFENNTYSANEEFTIDVNSADQSALTKIKGIGSSFSKRIIKYRDLLGGYVSEKQLMEVYGMDSVRYLNTIPYIEVNPYTVQKINVNTADFNELRAHPYISSNVALSIVNYRKMHGKYARLEEIMASVLIDTELFTKIAPYLTVE